MTVGELARRAGLRASAIGYYERLKLLPPAPRRSGRRDFSENALAHLAIVQFARECGFTLAETRRLVAGFPTRSTASERWQALAQTKVREMDALMTRAQVMKDLLVQISGCQCGTLAECGRKLLRRRERLGLKVARPEPAS